VINIYISDNILIIEKKIIINREKLFIIREHILSLILSMPMATKFDQRKKIKNLVKNKRNQINNLAKNFLLTNFNLIAKNNLNI
jgi:hypothetical protein